MDFLKRLRKANADRCPEFGIGDIKDVSLEFKTIELSGEVGELNNIVKKIIRGDTVVHDKGIEITIEEAFKREIADIFICIDLLAAKYEYDIQQIVIDKFNKTTKDRGYKTYLQ